MTLSGRCGVVFVRDDRLPEGHDFAFLVDADGVTWLAVKESRVTPTVLTEAWATYRASVTT